MTDNGVVGLTHTGQSERIRCRTVKSKEHLAISLENLTEAITGLLSEGIRPISI